MAVRYNKDKDYWNYYTVHKLQGIAWNFFQTREIMYHCPSGWEWGVLNLSAFGMALRKCGLVKKYTDSMKKHGTPGLRKSEFQLMSDYLCGRKPWNV